jgi:hypothetical protein
MGSRRRSRGTRIARLIGIWTLAAVLAAVSVFLLLPLAARLSVRAIVLIASACAEAAVLFSAGTDVWTIAATIGRSAGEALVGTQALTVVGALVLVGAVALYGLQRLLRSGGESSR